MLVTLFGNSLPEFTVAPGGPIDFGGVPVGSTATQIATIDNTAGVGQVDRTFTVSVTGSDFQATAANCTFVAAGQTCDVVVDFLPAGTSGPRADTLTIVDGSGATVTIDLAGNAL